MNPVLFCPGAAEGSFFCLPSASDIHVIPDLFFNIENLIKAKVLPYHILYLQQKKLPYLGKCVIFSEYGLLCVKRGNYGS